MSLNFGLMLTKTFFILLCQLGLLRYNEVPFQFFCNIKNNMNFSENSKICIFFIKNEEFVTNFRPYAYLNVFDSVFFIFRGQLGYIL